jgi:hypothetical protein
MEVQFAEGKHKFEKFINQYAASQKIAKTDKTFKTKSLN